MSQGFMEVISGNKRFYEVTGLPKFGSDDFFTRELDSPGEIRRSLADEFALSSFRHMNLELCREGHLYLDTLQNGYHRESQPPMTSPDETRRGLEIASFVGEVLTELPDYDAMIRESAGENYRRLIVLSGICGAVGAGMLGSLGGLGAAAVSASIGLAGGLAVGTKITKRQNGQIYQKFDRQVNEYVANYRATYRATG